MKKPSLNLRHMLLMASVINCLSFAVATKAEKVTEPVPDSAHMANDLREKLRSGNTGNTPEEMLGTVKRIAEYMGSPGDMTKNGDIPEYDIMVAGHKHFEEFLNNLSNPSLVHWDTDLKLPRGCRLLPNPPALAPIIIENAKINGPFKLGSWKIISCANKILPRGVGGNKNAVGKSWTIFARFYLSVTSAAPAEVIPYVRRNLGHAGYRDAQLFRDKHNQPTPFCGSGRSNDVCMVFFKKHANVFVNADYETLPDEYVRHPDRLTTYPPALAFLQEHLRRSPKITAIDIIELSLEPLDYPRQPIRGLDTAVDGIPSNHGPVHQ